MKVWNGPKARERTINLRRTEDNRHPRPLFLTLSQFSVIAFPLRVRHLRLPKAVKKSAPGRSRNLEHIPIKTENTSPL